MTNNVQEYATGSGTSIKDTKSAEKRAQITLKGIQLRLKQEKERAALQAQKKSLSAKEEIEESFSASQIAALKAEYSKINTVDPSSDTYKKLIAMLDRLDLKSLQSLAGAEIKFVSKLAQNRVMRKSMKKEDVQLDEISTKLLAKAAHAASDPDADYHYGKSHDPQKFADRAKKTKDAKSAASVQGAADAKGHYTRPGHSSGSYDKLAHRSPSRVTSAGKANKQDVNKLKGNIKRNEEVESIDEQHSVLYKMKKSDSKIAVAHYKSKDDADKFLASVKEKGGNGVVRVGKIGLDLTPTNKKINELSTNKLADYKKKAGADASAADKAGDMKKGNKRFSGIMKATRKQFDNDSKKEVTEMDNTDPHSGPEREVKPVTNKRRIVYKRHEKENVTEASQRVDSLVTDALKIMKGSDLKDAVQALKTVLGDREYNDRRGHYNFYVKQLVDMYGKKTNEELDIELAEVLSKDATAGDFIHDFVNSDNPKFAGKSKEKRKQMALAAYYAKQKDEELSPKQKALDKNKNGKIDAFDLAKLRGEELSAKQKALDKNKNGKIDASDLAKLRGEEMTDGDKSSMALRALVAKKKLQQTSGKNKSQAFIDRMVSRSKLLNQPKPDDEYKRKVVQHLKKKYNEETVNEKSDYEVYHKDYSTAVQTAIKQAEKRGYEVDMDDWHDKVATGPKKPSSGKTNSFSINLMKDGKPSKKKLQMQVYNMDNHKYELNMYIEEVEISEAGPGLWANIHAKRQRIKAGSNERMRKAGEKGAPEPGALDRARGKNEAASPAQQAAIAIAMKKAGKKPKDMAEADARVPRQPGQPANSKAHSDLYTDENPKGTIQGLKFATVEDAEASVSKIRNSDRTSAHKIQAAVAMEQRAKAAGKDSAAAVYRTYINSVSKKETYEGIVDKIKAIKRGMQAKDKADDHFDKAGDPKNPNASKDLRKAVRYHNLLNKEEVVLEARKKSFKDVKKKMKEEEVPNKSTVKKGDMLTGKREPIEINPELKEPAR